MVKAWNSAKVQADVKTKVDAVAKSTRRAHLGDQHVDNIHETSVSAQAYFDSFEEGLSDRSLEAGLSDQEVNAVEERADLAKTPNAAKHLGIH